MRYVLVMVFCSITICAMDLDDQSQFLQQDNGDEWYLTSIQNMVGKDIINVQDIKYLPQDQQQRLMFLVAKDNAMKNMNKKPIKREELKEIYNLLLAATHNATLVAQQSLEEQRIANDTQMKQLKQQTASAALYRRQVRMGSIGAGFGVLFTAISVAFNIYLGITQNEGTTC